MYPTPGPLNTLPAAARVVVIGVAGKHNRQRA